MQPMTLLTREYDLNSRLTTLAHQRWKDGSWTAMQGFVHGYDLMGNVTSIEFHWPGNGSYSSPIKTVFDPDEHGDRTKRTIAAFTTNARITDYVTDNAFRVASMKNSIPGYPQSDRRVFSDMTGVSYDEGGNGFNIAGFDLDLLDTPNTWPYAHRLTNTAMTYDGSQRLSTREDTVGWSIDRFEAYGGFDAVGNRGYATTDSETEIFSYDEMDRMTESDLFTFTHDDNGNMTSKAVIMQPLHTVSGNDRTMDSDILIVFNPVMPASQNLTMTMNLRNLRNLRTEGVEDLDCVPAHVFRYCLDEQAWSSGPDFDNHYVFTGREYEELYTDPNPTSPFAHHGIYHFRARYYDPHLGRFLQPDPIGFLGGDTNFYAYVRNNPINYVDPFGLSADCFKSVFWNEFRFNIKASNQFYFDWPWKLSRTAIGVSLAPLFAKATGSDTPLQAVKEIRREWMLAPYCYSYYEIIAPRVAGAMVWILPRGVFSLAGLGIGVGIGSAADAFGRAMIADCPCED